MLQELEWVLYWPKNNRMEQCNLLLMLVKHYSHTRKDIVLQSWKPYELSELSKISAIYGHRCHNFSDHEPLKSLLNTPHPSGKLA